VFIAGRRNITVKDWLIAITEPTIIVIDAIALVIIAFGTLEALIGIVRLVVSGNTAHARSVWIRYGRWLVAGLTFQLASDIIETSISTDWEGIARLGAIAVIRTFLNYFLERDIEERASTTENRGG
jgi:uncharacterized membrane protein